MHQWSTTPLSNQTADIRANWQENQPASSLNNSARGMMATAAFWRDDNLGTLVATLGANNVYSVVTGQGLIDPASTAGGGTARISHPFSLRVVLPAMNTAVATTAPTIVVDGAATVPLTRRDGTALADGDLTSVPVEILGDAITAGAYSRARVLDLLPSDIKAIAGGLGSLPIGSLIHFTGSNFPTGYLPAIGTALNRVSYAALWAHAQASGLLAQESDWLGNIGFQSFFSLGDGSTNFRIPHLGGLFLRATDYGRGIDPNRQVGTTQSDAFRSHTHPLTQGGVVISGYAGTAPAYVATGSNLSIDSIAATGGPETRPWNASYPLLIRAY